MEKTPKLVLCVPSHVREWVVKGAGERRMSISDYGMRLITLGIQAETIDEGVAKISAAVEAGGITRVVLRETIMTRYMVEQMAKGTIRNPVTLGTDAANYADQQLMKLWPKE